MPTGYTSKLHDAEQTFPQFAATCARAFGALIMRRDESMTDTLPPDAGSSSSYYAERVTELTATLARLHNCSLEHATAERDAEHAADVAFYEERKAKVAEKRDRYLRMLAHVRDWTPPTPDHFGMKEFMLEQLQTSIDHDCYEPTPPTEKLAPAEWLALKIVDAQSSLERATAEAKKEHQRATSRNAWLDALRDSLDAWRSPEEPCVGK